MALINSPVIPTNITVHLGKPNEAARNISVPFVEYIKSVASNEIYPAWPTDAIKANVLAQISFALNRYYNEWYRSQGYDFDITNSPIYDQKFVEDGQFFDSIALIVDEIFNNYIVKEDQVQPLFAQYCDGKTTTCNGLSQWGSVALAKQGKSPLEILKHYYGEDIQIIYNAPVAANIITYPGFPITLGSANDLVRILKIQLNRISQNYPAIPSISDLNQYFTVEMENAVKKFQNIFNLDETGIVDKATWYRIKYIYNAVKKISDIYSEGITQEEAELLFGNAVGIGATGSAATTTNYLLGVITYFDPSIPVLNPSGTFDQNTEDSVKAFQQKYNLPVTGTVDILTLKTLFDVYEQTLENIPEDFLVYRNEFFPGVYLSIGMTGEDVIRLQNFLLKICRDSHSIPGVKVNGIFDNLTEQSVKSLQQRFNLNTTGVVDPITWFNIVELSKEET